MFALSSVDVVVVLGLFSICFQVFLVICYMICLCAHSMHTDSRSGDREGEREREMDSERKLSLGG